MEIVISWLKRYIQWRRNELMLTRLVKRKQRQAAYPYCREGNDYCLSQTCSCMDGPIGRLIFRVVVRNRLREQLGDRQCKKI